jgi:hypothetical protein
VTLVNSACPFRSFSRLIFPVFIILALQPALLKKLVAGGPENLLLVVNSQSLESLAVANHYIALRGIPANNVLYLEGIPPNHHCVLQDFRDAIGEPVLKAIESRKLAGQIDTIAFSSGFPTCVVCPVIVDALREKVEIGDGKMFTPEASMTSMMAFYLYTRNNDPSFLLLDSNWYMSQESGDPLNRPFLEVDERVYKEGIAALVGEDWDEAIAKFEDLCNRHPGQVASRYQLARAYAGKKNVDQAVESLKLASRAGWSYRDYTEADAAFKPIASETAFQNVVASMPDMKYGRMPTRGFSGEVAWGPNGWPNSQPNQGKRIFLATLLGVYGGERGSTLPDILDMLQRSAKADSTFPQGSFYFAQTADVRTKCRESQFLDAAFELESLGFKVTIGSQDLPENRDNLLGCSVGAATPDWPSSHSRLAPGAIVDNLTSAGGLLFDKGSTQTPLTHFLNHGASGASGTVTEPFAIPNKFPHVRIHAHYARGCTLAEAFYQSVFGPFQLLIVGDPLCAPWAKRPGFSVGGIDEGMTIKDGLNLEFEPAADSPTIARYDLFIDGRMFARVPGSQQRFRVGSDGLPDGAHEIRVVAVDDSLIATRSSKIFQVRSESRGQKVELKIDGPDRYKLARNVLLAANSSFGERIEIRQNSRVVATIEGKSGESRIPCEKLGTGPVTLHAVVMDGDQEVRSNQVPIVIEY